MTVAHGAHQASSVLPVIVGVVLAGGYAVLATRQTAWSRARTASFLAGSALLVLALLLEADDFPTHMLQHLLIGMLAPTGLALGAPVTLLLRSVPRRWGRVVGRVLRAPVARLLTHPATILVLNLGGLVVLYATPLYAFTTHHETAHHLVHLHFLAAGYLFAWLIAGPDPAPHRPSVRTRLVLLGIAIAVHAVLSQLMYAGIGVDLPVPTEERRAGAQLMYFGGDIAELLLAFALVSTWRVRRSAAQVAVRARGAGVHGDLAGGDQRAAVQVLGAQGLPGDQPRRGLDEHGRDRGGDVVR